MKLLYTADLHGNREAYEGLLRRASLQDIGAIALGGDLCPRGGKTLQGWIGHQRAFLEEYLLPLFSGFREKYPKKEIFAIMGNDDFRKNLDVLGQAEAKGILFSIHGRSLKLHDDIHIAGYSFVNATPFRLKDWEKKDSPGAKMPPQLSPEVLRSAEEEEGTISKDMEKIAKLSDPKKTVYVIHAPPFNTNLDVVSSGHHVGSAAVRAFIEKHAPPATLHGHIHESPGMSGSWMDVVGSTVCVNVGSPYPKKALPLCIMDVGNARTIAYEEVPL